MPGLLVAATGVGAGDLVTASLAGSELGVTLLWAALAGALLKATLNEGLARWQLATGTTLIEGWRRHLPRGLLLLFALYLLLWSVVVSGALSNACGVAGAAFFPDADPLLARRVSGVVHAVLGLALVSLGGFRLFESVMAVCIVVMVVCVSVTAFAVAPPTDELLAGLVPSIPSGGLGWTLGVLGGVGGTVTLLNYGDWIAAHGRRDPSALGTCRLDISVAYSLTALFGVAMLIIGARLQLDGSGAGVALALAEQLGDVLGPAGRTLFLVGFWGAVFSSLLGVWQGVPLLAAQLLEQLRGRPTAPTTVVWLRAGLALLPLLLLWHSFRSIQLAYAVCGALFMPFLAASLLWLNGPSGHLPAPLRNRWLANSLLALTVAFFGWQGLASLTGTVR